MSNLLKRVAFQAACAKSHAKNPQTGRWKARQKLWNELKPVMLRMASEANLSPEEQRQLLETPHSLLYGRSIKVAWGPKGVTRLYRAFRALLNRVIASRPR